MDDETTPENRRMRVLIAWGTKLGGTESVAEVAVLMERVGARGHVTFGGRLSADAKGFPAAAQETGGDHGARISLGRT